MLLCSVHIARLDTTGPSRRVKWGERCELGIRLTAALIVFCRLHANYSYFYAYIKIMYLHNDRLKVNIDISQCIWLLIVNAVHI